MRLSPAWTTNRDPKHLKINKNQRKRRWDHLLAWFSKGLGRDCILLSEHPPQATRGHLYILKFQAIPQIRGTVDSVVPAGSANSSPG